MNITTTYKTNANGRGQVVAKSGGKQKTTNYNDALTSAENHGEAAAEFLLAKVEDVDSVIANVSNWTHDSNESGTVHKFSL